MAQWPHDDVSAGRILRRITRSSFRFIASLKILAAALTALN